MFSFLPREWRSLDLKTLLKIFLNSFLIFLGMGFYVPYVVEALHKFGFSDTLIGVSISLELIGFVVGALFINKTLQKISHKALYLWTLFFMTLILGALPFIIHAISLRYIFPHILFILSFFFGLITAHIYILHDSMVSHFASRVHHKTTLMGIYFTVISLGFITGSMSINAFDQLDTMFLAPGLYSLGIFAGCCFLIFSPKFPSLFAIPTKQNTLWEPFKILSAVPLLIFIAIGYALGGKVTRNFLDIYVEQSNEPTPEATFLLSILIAGSLFLPPFLGHLADKIKLHRALILYCALLSIAYGISFFISNHIFLTWPIFFLIGGMYAIFDGLGLAYISSRFTGALLVSGCMALEISESLSGAFFSPFIGNVMTYLGPRGFLGSIFILYFLLFILFVFYHTRNTKEKSVSSFREERL